MHCDKCGKNFSDLDSCCPYCGKEVVRSKNLIKKDDEKLTICKCFKNFFVKFISVDDIATVKEFLVIFIIHIIQNVILGLVNLNNINTILNILFFIPICALMIRRYHDTDLSGIFACLYGYALIAYTFSFFTDKDNVKWILLISALLTYALNFVLLIRKSNPKSRWNKDNGVA